MRRLMSIVLILTIILSSNTFASNLSTQKNKVSNQIKSTQAKINSIKGQKSSVMNQIEALESDLETVNGQLDNLDDQLQAEEAKLANAETQLDQALNAKDAQREKLKSRMIYMYQTPKTTYIEIILKSKNFSQMYNRTYYINQIMEHDKSIVNQLVANAEKIEASKKEIERSKLSVQLLKTDQLNKKHALEQTKVKKGAILVNLSANEKKYWEQMNALEQENKELEKKIQASLKGDTKKYTGGKFTWPVPGRYNISSPYGYRQSPISGKQEFHTGIDIPAPTGTSIVAAADGTVLTAGYVRGFGYTVIINHGSGITTLYGHNSALVVKAGQDVKKGQQISKAGSTGYSTGPHCHFQVNKNGGTDNPMNYLK